ncbi:FtsP/CotA-like multicopper oxidase with cupredoxin domain [Silvibacterium bohemicum]|uniref:FtsP/CotA-like multicopper oxidase with cupredoxin domain n=1 Tax=Silvibacterium bohemicum TaxID=1577686 RepID=A0A841K161_9BACT|nr:multicopper oxidase domain-containing protein [Silvibacterium bohemicum]MBB6144931.1 FtsP/CotA-like multicopper oxidase with cupredoxin domain [Silvibacterium bohemicum]
MSQIELQRKRRRERLFARVASSILFFCLLSPFGAIARNSHPGRGAISAQDLAKMVSTAVTGSDAADQVCARYATGSVVSAPPELESQNGVLEVTFTFQTVTDSQGLIRYCYVTNTGLEAPTLRVNPGDQLIIHFQNNLPPATAASDNMAGMKMTLSANDTPTTSTSSACNGAMGTSVTNIHFHGMNVAPVCGQDEVVHTLVQPGQSFDYNVQIPANEPPGLYWYHPHPHGISEGQVQGGATGALIVEGLQNVDTALAGLPERTFVLRDQILPPSEMNDSNIPAWDLSINYVPVTYPGYTPAVIQTNPGQQELWRVANTGADTILNLQYIVNGVAQTVQVVAIDGYPIASGSSGQQSVSQTSILLGPGARAEFVVTTPNVGDQAQLVTQYWNTGPDGDFDPARPIANIVSQNGIENSAAKGTAAVRRLPSHAKQTKVTRFSALASATPVAQRNLYFSEVLLDPTNPLSPTTFFITEEGQTPTVFTMDQQPNIVVHSGTVEDWVVENRAQEDHVFHIHQLHFQVLEVNGQPANDPAIRDTVDIPYWNGSGPYPSVKVRMDFRDPNVIGTFVYHCHILEHEDGGMMGEVQVLPQGSASTTTATASASSIDPNGNVTLTANVIDAATGNATPTGLVQFEINGTNVGDPVSLANGQATLMTPVNGNAGANTLTAFYQGDATYGESASAAIPLTISNFALSSPGTTAAVGSAATATVTINVANNYTSLINLSCTMPANLTESACFVNPNSITGTGLVSLTVNTTPAHPLSSMRTRGPGWFAASGGASLACVFLLAFPRRRWRSRAMFVSAFTAIAFTAMGCGGTAKTDPGTAKGIYMVVVTGSGTGQGQASVNVPITIQ